MLITALLKKIFLFDKPRHSACYLTSCFERKKTAININLNPIKWRKKISSPKITTDKIGLLSGKKLVNTPVVLAGTFETPRCI